LEQNVDRQHGIIEDLAAEIGYTAASSLVDWFGGGNLWIPTEADQEHPIAKVIGMPAMRRLVKLYEGKVENERLLWLPLGYQREIDRRDRMIAVLLSMGLGSKQVGSIASMSESHVRQVRTRVEEMGILPLILRKAGLQGKGGEKSLQKPGRKAR
jgi:hypothetical protein